VLLPFWSKNSILEEFNTRIYIYENITRRMVDFVRVLPHDIKNINDQEKEKLAYPLL